MRLTVARYLQSTGNVDKITEGGNLQRENIGKGLERAGKIMVEYLEFIGSLNPVGGFIFSIDHLFKGEYVAGIIGMAAILPWERFAALLNNLPEGAFKLRFAGREELTVSTNAIEALRGLKPAQQKEYLAALRNANSAEEAKAVLAKLESLIPPGKPPLPPPREQIRFTWEGHRTAALAEEQLAREIHNLPDQAVVTWGGKVSANGADIVSVNIKNGDVTLWDAKYRTDPVKIQDSKTFSESGRLQKAVLKAIAALEANTTLPQDVVKTAIDNLERGIFKTRTVGFGNVKNSVVNNFP